MMRVFNDQIILMKFKVSKTVIDLRIFQALRIAVNEELEQLKALGYVR